MGMGGMEEEREEGKVSEPGAARELQMEDRQGDGKEKVVSEPGAARHGNFINYYEFHPPEERLRLLPDDMCKEAGMKVEEEYGETKWSRRVVLLKRKGE